MRRATAASSTTTVLAQKCARYSSVSSRPSSFSRILTKHTRRATVLCAGRFSSREEPLRQRKVHIYTECHHQPEFCSHLPASPSQASANLPTPGGRHLPNHLSYLWEPVLDSLVSFLSPLLPLSRMLRLFILDFDVYQKERDAAKTARMLVPSLLRFFSAHKSWGEGFAPPPLAVNISALRSTSPRLQFSTAPTIRRRLGGEQVARKKKGREKEMS